VILAERGGLGHGGADEEGLLLSSSAMIPSLGQEGKGVGGEGGGTASEAGYAAVGVC